MNLAVPPALIDWQPRTRLIFGPGVVARTGALAAELGLHDVLLVCAPKYGTPFVASHVLGDKPPVIESFPQSGSFFASDDGSLAFAGPCQRAKVSRSIVCVRTQGGVWQELDLDGVGADAGALEVVRWVPRSDGSALGFVAGPSGGLVDGRTGELKPWVLDGAPDSVKSM